MFTNANVRPANDAVWSATGLTLALTESNGASETVDRRAHAPRSAKPKDAASTTLHFDISSTGELDSATPRLRISDCARRSLRVLDRIQASYRLRGGYSPADQVRFAARFGAEDRVHIRVTRDQLRRSTLTVSASLYPIANRNSPNCAPNSSPDSAQTKSIPGPIPRAVHRSISFSCTFPSTCARTTTRVSKQLTESANDCIAHQISRNKS
jgi:hypothetical protein